MRAWQKIYVSGNSTVITLPRALMYALDLLPGDYIAIETIPGTKQAIFRKLEVDNIERKSFGVIAEQPEPLKP